MSIEPPWWFAPMAYGFQISCSVNLPCCTELPLMYTRVRLRGTSVSLTAAAGAGAAGFAASAGLAGSAGLDGAAGADEQAAVSETAAASSAVVRMKARRPMRR